MAKARPGPSQKLLDLWQAPEGAGAPIAIFATSFTFDAEFFEVECLGRFAGLQGRTGEGNAIGDLAYLLELEERLADIDVTILVDRSFQSEGHPLRFDVLPIGLRGGLLHAKTAVLVWESRVRVLIGSANLTPAGYRRQLETMAAFEAHTDSEVPRQFFEETFAALRELVDLIPADGLVEGPHARADRALGLASLEIGRIELPAAWPNRLRSKVSLSRPGRNALTALREVWQGGPARNATVISPFFDSDEGQNRPVGALVELLAQRGERQLNVIVPVDDVHSHTVVHAPKSLLAAVPAGIDSTLYVFEAGQGNGARRLHAKGVLLTSGAWTAALLGSSNFTTSGLGLSPSVGHLEINLALGAPDGSDEEKMLVDVFERSFGKELDPSDVRWEPQEDEEEGPVLLPWGFSRALLEPGPPPTVEIALEAESLPEIWSILAPNGDVLYEAQKWRREDSPETVRIVLPGAEVLFHLLVEWREGELTRRLGWALNVTDRGLLPPRPELGNLTVDEILTVLASTRPLHDAMAKLIDDRRKVSEGRRVPIELDPLRRYSSTGHLLSRTREFSQALAGLERHLNRPAYSLAALRWRLVSAPWSPTALAHRLIDEANLPKALEGEAAFRLAELARALSGVRWEVLVQGLDPSSARDLVNEVLQKLRETPIPDLPDRRLTDYVRAALGGRG